MIVVTAPTGQIGSQLVDRLLEAGEDVRVIVRDPGRLDAAVRARVDVVAGSHGDAAVVDRAFAGADAVFWLVFADPRAPDPHTAYVDFSAPGRAAMARHAVPRVVGISALGRGTARERTAGNVTASLALDDAIAATGVAYRALTLPSFMDNVLRRIALVRETGVLTIAASADRAAPLVATRDAAAAAAALLTDTSWDGVAEQPVLGPADLAPDAMARTLADVLGRPVEFRRQPLEELRAGLLAAGASDGMAASMVEMYDAKEHGLDAAAVRTPATASPTSFREWCELSLSFR